MQQIRIGQEFTFDSAHKLPDYNGECSQLHGHTYRLIVTFMGEINKKTGMVKDFKEFKNIIGKWIKHNLDHKYLNNIFKNPTAEIMAQWIFKYLSDVLGLQLVSIKLWGTPNSFVEVFEDDIN